MFSFMFENIFFSRISGTQRREGWHWSGRLVELTCFGRKEPLPHGCECRLPAFPRGETGARPRAQIRSVMFVNSVRQELQTSPPEKVMGKKSSSFGFSICLMDWTHCPPCLGRLSNHQLNQWRSGESGINNLDYSNGLEKVHLFLRRPMKPFHHIEVKEKNK